MLFCTCNHLSLNVLSNLHKVLSDIAIQHIFPLHFCMLNLLLPIPRSLIDSLSPQRYGLTVHERHELGLHTLFPPGLNAMHLKAALRVSVNHGHLSTENDFPAIG